MKKNILSLLIAIWVLIAFFSVVYNVVKSVSEISEWGYLTDYGKREKIFGDVFKFSLFIKEETHGKSVLIFSKDDMPYFFSRYYLYPQLIFWDQNRKEILEAANTKKYDYIAFFNEDLQIKGYRKISNYLEESGESFGSIYKKE